MIFRQVDEIRSGRKTQTRRVCKPGDYAYTEPGTARITATATSFAGKRHRLLYQRGEVYAVVPGRGKRAVGHIRITAIRRQRLQDITEADARAEGVESVAAYRALWESLNGATKGARWDDNPEVWVYAFLYVADAS